MRAKTVVWIVHREPEQRAALMRLAALPDATPQGSPGDAVFREAPAPDVVVLGLAGDLERELEFVHRVGTPARSSRWILVGNPEQVARARGLFDLLPATYLIDTPEPAVLREAIDAAASDSDARPLALSQRRTRDGVSARFARALADLELPILLRAIDPRLVDVPLLVLGEPGTGRSTLARYVHHFGGTAGGAFLELPCTPETQPEQLLERAAGARSSAGASRAVTLWLAGPGDLPPATQRIVSGWIRFGFPPGNTHSPTLRWIATDTGERLDRDLRRNLSGLSLRLPPLREQRERLPQLVVATARAWCQSHRLPTRRFDDRALALLEEYPWPGNLQELEAVVEQSLAGSASDPLECEDLILDGAPLGPTVRATGAVRSDAIVDTPESSAEIVLELLGEEEPALDQAHAAGAAAAESTLGAATTTSSRELRDPLSSMRSFEPWLPDGHDDPDFRDSFEALVTANATHAGALAERLEALGETPAQPQPIDVSALLQAALELRRPRIHAQRLVVLEELDPRQAEAHCDPEQIEFVFEVLLDEVLRLVPESGDVYLASRRHEAGLRGGPCIRVLIRYRGPNARAGQAASEISPAANSLGFAIASLVVWAQNATLTLDSGERGETLLLVDLPA
ncbi:MAG: hypothetical protein GY772_26130 [bacterium]|nr:hypothetical protein [bacterium]